ncbi:hypothetical protein PR048_013023 [Dryococelus australis]|uniref:Uncharacterized protein n=1 Tax=Dryococelus australis TaxID=614101 RepID=A0ABQ9HR54_9NEOP|nr:hypothetical protein PR048_013023 [Dryococelus australis]
MNKCYKNSRGTSTAMESDGIVADFQKSVEIHELTLDIMFIARPDNSLSHICGYNRDAMGIRA